jgi:hypothetical protein
MFHTWQYCHVSCIRWIGANIVIKVSLVALLATMWILLVPFAWDGWWGPLMHNSSNFHKLKFIKILNKSEVAHNMVNTSQTYASQSTDCPTFSFNSFVLRSPNLLASATYVTNINCFCLHVFGTSHHYLMKNYQIQGCHAKLHWRKKPWCKRKTQLRSHLKTLKTTLKFPKS